MKKRLALLLLLVVMTSSLIALPCFAIALPDSTPSVVKINVYRNFLATGDWLVLIYHNIPYATTPTEPINQAYMWRLFKTDNTTEIAATLPYAFNDNGYGYNLSSIYLSAANVTAAGITWGQALPLKLSGNPSVFTTLPLYNFNLSSSDYSALTTSTDVKAELAARILAIASDLDIRWALGATYSLLNETETGTVLSVYGEAFFRGAIYGLQGLCPQVFAYVVSDMELTDRTWSTTYIDSLKNQNSGTWVDSAKNALDALFGTSYSIIWLIISLIAAFIILYLNFMVTNDPWIGIMDGLAILILASRLGFFDLGYLGLMGAIAVMYESARIWGVFK